MPQLLSYTSKMPGASLSLPAGTTCPTGAKYRNDPNGICSKCYAQKGLYNQPKVKECRQWRLAYTQTAEFVTDMVGLLHREARLGRPHFRWHDSGDTYSLEYGHKIMDIIEATPEIWHYIPTKEVALFTQLLAARKKPRNVVVRISAVHIDQLPASIPAGCQGCMTFKTARPTQAFPCHATMGDHSCGACRACWNPNIPLIAYKLH